MYRNRLNEQVLINDNIPSLVTIGHGLMQYEVKNYMPITDLAGFEPVLLFNGGKRQVQCSAVSEVHASVHVFLSD